MPTAQDRSRVGAQLPKKARESLGFVAKVLRDAYGRNKAADDDSILLSLADEIDQIAMPIVITERPDR